MKKVYIVGGNGLARECYMYLKTLEKSRENVCFAGFLGHGGYGHTVDYKNLQKYYLGEVSGHEFKENEYAIIGAGYPKIREQIYNDLKLANIKMYTLITADSYINELVSLGEGNIFNRVNITSPHIKIGNGNLFNIEIIIGHDATIGDFNFFGPRSQILGNVTVGNSNTFGANSIMLPNSKIGNNNKIAPLSAVYKGCKNNVYMIGNPALNEGNVK